MPAIGSYAPGKCILLGEHSVVYNRPAIAFPVTQLQAHAVVMPRPMIQSGEILVQAPDISLEADLDDLPSNHPLARAIHLTLAELQLIQIPAFLLRVTSTIPLAAGLGSSAAVSVAVIRAVSEFLGVRLSDEKVSHIAYKVEELHHGTPSGVDNAVIAYAQPVFYVRGHPIQYINISDPFTLIIANTGISSLTADAVADVRKLWQKNPAHTEKIFDSIASLVNLARHALEQGPASSLGPLLTQNHEYLREIKVSCPELDHLVKTALQAGALGAKLSGGGRGGNMIAIVEPQSADDVAQALRHAGATSTIITRVEPRR